jgi:lipopolysaccharide biosynthesis glycosyltransferase
MHICFNIDKGYLLQAGVFTYFHYRNNPNKRFSFNVFTDEVEAEKKI